MFSFCRLCAKYMEQMELTTDISNVESKLKFCCGWKRSLNEDKMPQMACSSCVEQLEQCWNFTELIYAAEKQLHKLINDPDDVYTEDIVVYSDEVKIEDNRSTIMECSVQLERIKTPVDCKNVDDVNDDTKKFDGDFDCENTFDAPFTFSDAESVESNISDNNENIKKTIKKKQLRDRFFASLMPEDCLEGGRISVDGIARLEKLFPEMKTMSWNDCQYKCDKCDSILLGPNNIYTHIRATHADEAKSFDVCCFYCNSKHRRDYSLNNHIISEHFVHLKYRCKYCTDYYWDTRELTRHQKLHKDIEFKCELCEYVCSTQSMFYGHITLNHFKKSKPKVLSDETFICDLCQKTFTTKGGIRNHMLLHTGRFDHICHLCGWKFQAKGNLKGHLQSVHTTIKSFRCDQCGKLFKTKHQMNNHAKHHEDVRPFACEVCGRKFRRPYTLNVHMRSHTNTCPYVCRFCGKKFRHNITLRTHERAHCDDKPYACPICTYKSTSKGNLNKHMLRVHSIDFRNHINQSKDITHRIDNENNTN